MPGNAMHWHLFIELFLKAALQISSHPSYQKHMKLFQTADNYVKRRQEKVPFDCEDFFQRLRRLSDYHA
jgi:hypothetical protein